MRFCRANGPIRRHGRRVLRGFEEWRFKHARIVISVALDSHSRRPYYPFQSRKRKTSVFLARKLLGFTVALAISALPLGGFHALAQPSARAEAAKVPCHGAEHASLDSEVAAEATAVDAAPFGHDMPAGLKSCCTFACHVMAEASVAASTSAPVARIAVFDALDEASTSRAPDSLRKPPRISQIG